MLISLPSCRHCREDAKKTVCVISAGSTSRDIFLYRAHCLQPKEAASNTPDDLALEYTTRPLPLDWHNGCSTGTRLGKIHRGSGKMTLWKNPTVFTPRGICQVAAHRKENRCARNKIHHRFSALPNGQFGPKVAGAHAEM